jgi:hypothetical protein
MLYRVLKALSLGEGKTLGIGEFTRLEWLTGEQVVRLTGVGAVSEVAPPPLSELPGWQGRAVRLAAIGISDAATFLERDPHEIAALIKGLKAATIARWQAEARRWLIAEPKRG